MLTSGTSLESASLCRIVIKQPPHVLLTDEIISTRFLAHKATSCVCTDMKTPSDKLYRQAISVFVDFHKSSLSLLNGSIQIGTFSLWFENK